MGRRMAVRFLAFGFRRGLTIDQARDLLELCFPYRDTIWQDQALGDAQDRNRNRLRETWIP